VEAAPTPASAEEAAPREEPADGVTADGVTADNAADDAAPSLVAEVTATLLNVRSEPNTSAEILREVALGEQYEVVAQTASADWAQLAENGETIGWAAAEFLDIQEGSVAAPETQPGTTESDDAADEVAQQPTESDPPAQQPVTGPPPGGYLPATMSSPDYGAQAFLWWRPEVADRDLKLMDEAGFNWVKQAFAWETIEGAGKGQYDWSIADRVVQHVNNEGLKLLARLSSDPELEATFWAGAPPGNADDFADFAFTVASRYNCSAQAVGCIQAYQVWNEPNLAREWGNNPPNPAQYAEFLRKTYAAIKRGNPNAIVINAGMAPTGDCCTNAMPDDQFYEQMYQAMGGNSDGYFDMLGVHGAGFAAPPELDPAEAAANQAYGGYRFFAFRRVEDIRAIMVKYGDEDKRVVLLEFGWTYDPVNPSYKWHGADAGIDEFVQAEYLRGAYQWAEANWQPWIALMSLLTMPNLDWTNDGNPRDEEQYWWAIMEPSQIDELKFRPAYIFLCDYFNRQKGQVCIHDPALQ
jgi:uncharacterized protein YraI